MNKREKQFVEHMSEVFMGPEYKKQKRIRLIRRIIAGVLGFGAFGILWATAEWEVAIAVFMIVWGHNLEKHS